MTIRTRFAPSPTGYLHVGNLRTALYAYIVAKQSGGQFILRLEDTDRERYVPDSLNHILRALYWVGIIPDEGVTSLVDGKPIQKGDKGPYIQSERLPLYQKCVQELLDKGFAYYCFCAPERLMSLRELQQKNKLPTGYDGHCLKLSAEEIKQHLDSGQTKVVRLKMPKEGETTFHDLVRGDVTFKNSLVDDQVLLKSDGFPTYHLAVVVDDHFMEITHVIRGDEWVSSTPKHIQLYTYFGWEPPQFAHLSLFLNADKSKLSKRQGDVAVDDYRQKGYLPDAMLNFMAFLGWNPGTEKEMYTLSELIQDFSLEKVSKAGAVFNLEKLAWYNKEYMKLLPIVNITTWAFEFFTQDTFYEPYIQKLHTDKTYFEKVLLLERERVTTLAELPGAVKFIFKIPDYQKELLVWRKGTMEEVQKILPELKDILNNFGVQDWNKVNLEIKVGEWITEKGYSTGSVLWPLRVALSGQQNSPGPYEIAEVLGKEESLKRVESAIIKIG